MMSKKVIGITGPIGGGKSTVSAILAKHGGFIIDADKISKEALLINEAPYLEVIATFGEQILREDKTINRALLLETIIQYPNLKDKLEGIIHPYVINRTISLLNKNVSAKFFVVDAPLLFEAGMEKLCDFVLFVDVDPQLRYIRLKYRNTMSLNDAKNLEDSIFSNDKKKEMSDFIIENNGSLEQLHELVFSILTKLRLLN